MEILFISDTHGKHKWLERTHKFPMADMIIHAGDVTMVGDIWEIEPFLQWYSGLTYEYKIFIAGNHDYGFETNRHTVRSMIPDNVIYLEDSGVEIEGLNFWGSPVTSPFNNWAFNVETDKRIEHWNIIPDDTDVLITHSPPYGIKDISTYVHEHIGCPYLTAAVKNRIKPKLHVFGHVHSAYGIEEHEGIMYVNATVLNERYGVDIRQPPILLDI
jgi:Icc-related predicted phosphoesterase